MGYTIGAFSKLTDISIDTLRYYEKENLIIPKRDEVNRRVYDDRDIAWVEFIKKLKLTGMSIKNMKKYATLRYQGDETIQDRLGLLYEQLDILVQKRREIEGHIEFLNNKIEIYKNMIK